MGYAQTAFLSFPSDPHVAPPALAAGEASVATQPGRSLNLRSSKDSSTKANILAYIPYNTKITLIERGPSWCKVQYKGIIGYVMTGFLRLP